MNVLVIGSGGREHALVWKLAQSPHLDRIFCSPGSDGIAQEPKTETRAIDFSRDFEDLCRFVQKEDVELTIVGPEVPLARGIVNAFQNHSLKVVGPSRSAAQLESSKAFAKNFMSCHGIPTADFSVCDSADQALDFVKRCRYDYPLVIKADGLAAGKGVVLAENYPEAETTILQFMTEKILGEAGSRIVVEECLQGEECSFMVFSDGAHFLPMVPSQDHKRVFDNDQGPNTGGMGAYSEDGILSPEQREKILKTIVEPTLRGMKSEGLPFIGILYFGLMLTPSGPKVLEYNCRFGDPETQAVLMRLETDLFELFDAITATRLNHISIQWSSQPSVCVVLTSGGYPRKFEIGKPIHGLEDATLMEGVKIFHAGTKRVDGSFVTSGGRVLGVAASGRDLLSAVRRAYDASSHIRFEGMHYRRDIAAGRLSSQR